MGVEGWVSDLSGGLGRVRATVDLVEQLDTDHAGVPEWTTG
jgi:hypothetical protein